MQGIGLLHLKEDINVTVKEHRNKARLARGSLAHQLLLTDAEEACLGIGPPV